MNVIICSSAEEARGVASHFGLLPDQYKFVFYDDPTARLEDFSPTAVFVYATPPPDRNFVDSSIYAGLVADLRSRGFSVAETGVMGGTGVAGSSYFDREETQ